jgi:RNA polymerase sigma-70 factor (ECF subfamily)
VKDARPLSHPRFDRSDERALAERLVARDQTALAALYDRYSAVVYALALRITGSSVEAEEVVIDSFWQVWQQADRYDQTRGQLGAWIFTIARSRALDRVRAQRRSLLVAPDEQAEAEAARQAAANENPERALWLSEQAALVREALAELSPEQRKAIELAYYHGLSHTEIAELLGEPLGTVKTRIRLGLLKMRQSISNFLARSEGANAD